MILEDQVGQSVIRPGPNSHMYVNSQFLQMIFTEQNLRSYLWGRQ